MAEATLAAENAYAPYSHFRVGAALRLANGKIAHGCNQENAAYPSGLCAERVALYSHGAAGNAAQEITAMAITAIDATGTEQAAFSCGGCRQVMIESEKRNGKAIPLLMSAGGGQYILLPSVALLVPFHFEFATHPGN